MLTFSLVGCLTAVGAQISALTVFWSVAVFPSAETETLTPSFLLLI